MTYDDGQGVIFMEGDCIEVMRTLEADSVDSVVCDPPYGISFMGKDWDNAGMLGQMAVGDEQRGAYAYGGTHSRGYADNDNRKFQVWCEQWAAEAFRVLKPGGHLLAFGGTRTYHRMASGIEDAGFDIRDCIMWLYGSGFPKSMNVAKAIDKAQGVEGERGEMKRGGERLARLEDGARDGQGTWGDEVNRDPYTYVPGSDEAKKWDGWGTALKPAVEPIVVARKPLIGTVIENVLTHGTGAMNIDATRIDSGAEEVPVFDNLGRDSHGIYGDGLQGSKAVGKEAGYGRWPANVILGHSEGCVEVGQVQDTFGGGAKATSGFVEGYEGGDGFAASHATVPIYECVDGCPAKELDEQSGTSQSVRTNRGDGIGSGYGGSTAPFDTARGVDDFGGASRFFYVAKASTAERNEGLDGFVAQRRVVDGFGSIKSRQCNVCGSRSRRPDAEAWPACGHEDWEWAEQNEEGHRGAETRNTHPTVKPIALMRYLCKLVTPPGGIVLDPFAGSGTCGVAAIREDFGYIGIELTPEYVAIAEARLSYARKYLAEPLSLF